MARVCYACRTEVDLQASVCPSCRAELGRVGHDGVATKPKSLPSITTIIFGGCGILLLTSFVVGVTIASLGSSSSTVDVAAKNRAEVEAREKISSAKEKKELEATIKSHKVFIGMTADDARKSWGKPNHVNRTRNTFGTSEQWVYGSNYLYVENGIVTSLQN